MLLGPHLCGHHTLGPRQRPLQTPGLRCRLRTGSGLQRDEGAVGRQSLGQGTGGHSWAAPTLGRHFSFRKNFDFLS